MGQPKQLLPWGKTTLIEHQIRTLIKTENPVNVILGFSSDLIIPLIENYPVSIIINNEWERGIGSSISFGILQIMRKYTKADGVLICLVDQPLVPSSYFEKMLEMYRPGFQQILMSQSVSGWTGVPVLFDKCYFNDLSKLRKDEGAKKIIEQHEENAIILKGCEILDDIDSPESYKQLRDKYID
jgi:molybdenum cofactor cytidylyltransferase